MKVNIKPELYIASRLLGQRGAVDAIKAAEQLSARASRDGQRGKARSWRKVSRHIRHHDPKLGLIIDILV